MARTDDRRNVILVVSRDAISAGGSTSYKGRGVEVQTDGTLALGTAQTGATFDEVLLKLRNSGGTGAQYNPEEILKVVQVPTATLNTAPSP